MKFKFSLVILPIVVLGISAGVFAKNSGGSYCSTEFFPIAEKLTNDLVMLGNRRVNRWVSNVDVKQLKGKLDSMSCLPVKDLDQTLKINTELNSVELLVTDSSNAMGWGKLELRERYELIIHALLVLAGFEIEEENYLSIAILEFLRNEVGGEYFLLALQGEKIVVNRRTNIVSVHKPVFQGKPILANSAYCMFYGLRKIKVKSTFPYEGEEEMGVALLSRGEYYYFRWASASYADEYLYLVNCGF